MAISLKTLTRHLVRESSPSSIDWVGFQGVAKGETRKMASTGSSQDQGFSQKRL